MNKPLRVPDYLGHILQAMDRIGRYTAGLDEPGFMANELVQDAVIRNVEIIGEAANNIRREAPDFANEHSGIPWRVLYGMRNRVSHGYHVVDLGVVWRSARDDLPKLRVDVQSAHAAAVEHDRKSLAVPGTSLASTWNATPSKHQEAGPIVAMSDSEVIQDAGRGRHVVWDRRRLQDDALVLGESVTIHEGGVVDRPRRDRDRGR